MSPSHAGNDSGSVSAVTVYDLAPDCTADVVEVGTHYHATVNGVVEYGVFVDLSDAVSGLVHDSELEGDYRVGDALIVRLEEIRDNGDLGFTEVQPDDYRTEIVEQDHGATVAELGDAVGDTVHVAGEIVQIRQTGGPTIFQVRDATGVVPCAGFEEAGVRAYPDLDVGDLARFVGTVERHDGSLQIEVERVESVDDPESVRADLDDALDEAAEPHDTEPLVEWPAFDQLRDDLAAVAKTLRRAILDGRPIRMRHHADGDGMCASVPLQLALERYIAEVNEDPDAPRHLLRRLPSKAPFYEMEDVTRDLNFALEDRERHGQKLPLLLMLDNGSTEEDTPAYRTLAEYDIPIVVVDHHHPDPEAVEPYVEEHVNPYLHGEDYRITTGMMCVELARMIDPDLTDSVRHVPAVAGLCDRSRADAMDDYLALAREAGYDEDDLDDIGEALDYVAFWLRYNDGSNLVNDVLGVDCDDRERHEELVAFLSSRAERDRDRQLDVTLSHTEHETLDNGAHLYRVDVENHAHRFTYPAPGKTTGAIHDHKVREHAGDPVITIGYGPDFAVLRSDGVRLDIPEMVTQLVEEHPGAGVSGGGHLVVGSIKFVSGRREEVIDALVEKMADANIDEELRSTLLRD
ncbi:DHH family phosphoesterase [Halomarina halobia]|uniref:DHH family phosphoesterase n=1 Tax=Halomarina halobia TaxID=3033386 RepID=A0ABD6ACS4_9EURY|nr:OB-fold nucleic acid binding domain-containing protein [Halomarina sp. PSR21]